MYIHTYLTLRHIASHYILYVHTTRHQVHTYMRTHSCITTLSIVLFTYLLYCTSHCKHTYMHTLHYITCHYFALEYFTLHYITCHYITSSHITSQYATRIHTYTARHKLTRHTYTHTSQYITPIPLTLLFIASQS